MNHRWASKSRGSPRTGSAFSGGGAASAPPFQMNGWTATRVGRPASTLTSISARPGTTPGARTTTRTG
ncbi:MAG: hypothetical protein E6K73_03330 [Candidatus Eisenbacteria bacterium]|uniref:Uncharacterized protein n=1 Tax=Eiseniibacteriota bacterium TaxID=2212470 RepID=A0A538SLP9_UNCEI|nr:MAG: hypothetical protein E6K73_03330 [Candidatus Eisenbacteria bacterium]